MRAKRPGAMLDAIHRARSSALYRIDRARGILERHIADRAEDPYYVMEGAIEHAEEDARTSPRDRRERAGPRTTRGGQTKEGFCSERGVARRLPTALRPPRREHVRAGRLLVGEAALELDDRSREVRAHHFHQP